MTSTSRAAERRARRPVGTVVRGSLRTWVRRARNVPLAVWSICALFAATGILHSFITPLGSAPDELTHADLIFWLAEGNDHPAYDGRLTSKAAVDALHLWGNSELFPNTADKAGWFREGMGETFASLQPEIPKAEGRYNQMPQHPPLYYQAAMAHVRVDRELHGGATGWFGEWHRLRIALFAPLSVVPLLVWSAARRLGGSPRAAITASLFTLAVPQLLHVTSSLNNDGYLVLFGAFTSWLLAGVVRAGPGAGRSVAIGSMVGAALLTKAFAVVLPIWVAVVYGRRARRHPDERRRCAADVLRAGLVTSAVAGWWWIGNLVRHGTPSPTTESSHFTTAMQPPGFEPDVVWYVTRFASWLPRRFFGWFGWFNVPLPVGFAIVACTVVAGAVAFAFGRRHPGLSRIDLAAFLSVVPMVLIFVFVRAYSLYVTTGHTPFIQGRYLFLPFVSIAVVVGVGLTNALGRRAAPALLAGAIILQVASLGVMLRGFWGPPDASWSERIESLRAWNPGLVDPLWWTAAAVLPLLVVVVAVVLRNARAGGDERGRPALVEGSSVA